MSSLRSEDRAPALALACLALVLCVSGAASAQSPLDPAVGVSLPGSTLALDAGAREALSGAIENVGRVDGRVTLEALAPEGWRVEVEPAEAFDLAAGASVPVVVRVVAPAASEGAAEGAVVLRATLTDAAGRSDTAEASVVASRVDPVPVVVPPPWWEQAMPLLVGGAFVAAGAGSGAFAWHRRRRQQAAREAAHRAFLERETGILLRLDAGPAQYGWQRALTYRLVVENASDRPRVAVARVASCPEGWAASLNLPRVPLSAGEKAHLSLRVEPPSSAEPGSFVTMELGCRPEEAREREERLELTVEAPAWRVPVQRVGEAEPLPRPRLRP